MERKSLLGLFAASLSLLRELGRGTIKENRA